MNLCRPYAWLSPPHKRYCRQPSFPDASCFSDLRGDTVSIVDVLGGIVYVLDIVALIGNQSTLLDRYNGICIFQQVQCYVWSATSAVVVSSPKGSPLMPIYNDVAFVAPEKLIFPLIVLIGDGMNAKLAVGIVFWGGFP